MSDELRIGAETTPKQWYHQNPTPAWAIAPKGLKPGAHCTTYRQLWSMGSVFPRSFVRLNLFQAVRLIGLLLDNSPDLRTSVGSPSCLYTLGEEGPSESCQYQGLPEALELFTS